MADTKTSEDSRPDGGVLANLPRTRPQRSSARRTASRGATTNGARAARATRGKRTSEKARSATATAPPQADRDVSSGSADASAKAKTKSKSRVRATRPSAATARSSPPRRTDARKGRADRSEERAPRQGFESYSESAGGSVQPPGGPEFVATAAEIVGELAKAGLSTGERLLKDVLSRLPLS